jgi:hypothetical protein
MMTSTIVEVPRMTPFKASRSDSHQTPVAYVNQTRMLLSRAVIARCSCEENGWMI